MRLTIISSAPILLKNKLKQAYMPYVKEMDLWMTKTLEVTFVCPNKHNYDLLVAPFKKQEFNHIKAPRLEFHNFKASFKSILSLPYNTLLLLYAMSKADHIHLRCPGNLALIGCIIQIFFPRKKKSAKYAGNWDPNSKQPFSYRLQKAILNNTFFTRNMKVMAYGQWPQASSNILPFFTASYSKNETFTLVKKDWELPLKAVFAGVLSQNKEPIKAVQLIGYLRKKGISIELDILGEGPERTRLENCIKTNNLTKHVRLRGNQDASAVKHYYQNAHFVILLSKSEGWPKAVAEGMFWGCIPIATPVSCVPWMLDYGNRGVLLPQDTSGNFNEIFSLMKDKPALKLMSKAAKEWSQKYTLEKFESAIYTLL